MSNNQITITPLIKSVLTASELEFLKKHYEFLCSLNDGSRSPSTPEQRHFVEVASGLAFPKTEYELIWQKYSSLAETKHQIDSLEKQINLLNQDIAKYLNENSSIRQKNEELTKAIEDLKAQQKLVADKMANLVRETDSMVNLSEHEANFVVSKLGNDDQESVDIAKSMIDKIKRLHRPKSPSPNADPSWEVCKACGSNSPNLCRCSE